MANVTIDIAAQFKGKPAFKQAESSVSGLDKLVGGLAKKFAGAFAAKKVLEFGVAAVKAFTEDEAAAAKLAKTVDNLGLGFANPEIAAFIDKMTLASGVADSELRPALQQLISTTGAVTYSQDLLNQAIDIAKGSGESLSTVVADLSKAYTGNTKGLEKYKTGLSKAELAGLSFEELMGKLNGQFGGSNAAYLDTYAGKIGLIKNAAGEATEAIGHGLVDAFSILAEGSSGDITSITDGMVKLAESIGDVFRGAAFYIKEFIKNPVVQKIIQIATWFWDKFGKKLMMVQNPALGAIFKAAEKGKTLRKKDDTTKLTAAQQAALLKKDTLAKEKAAKTLAAKQLKIDKAKALAKSVFDIDQIELVAALAGKLSDQDRLRAEAQLALLAGNDALATKLTNQIIASQDKTGELAKFLQSLPDANNPFKHWDEYLLSIQDKIKIIAAGGGAFVSTYTSTDTTGLSAQAAAVVNQTDAATLAALQAADDAQKIIDSLDSFLNGGSSSSSTGVTGGNGGTVVLQLDGKDLAVASQGQSLNGNQSYVDRRTGGFNW